MSAKSSVELEFSCKYDARHAKEYCRKHRTGWARHLSHWREAWIARKALRLAGDPVRGLDLPCGAGRFWPMLLENPGRVLLAADNSSDMLATARRAQPQALERIRLFQTSVFDTGLADEAVDDVFCMRLLHYIGDAAHRLAMLRELHRVTRETLVVSLWVDGNYKSWRRKRREARKQRNPGDYQNRFVIEQAVIESEFQQAGFDLAGYCDFLPGYAMWRIYVLRKPRSH